MRLRRRSMLRHDTGRLLIWWASVAFIRFGAVSLSGESHGRDGRALLKAGNTSEYYEVRSDNCRRTVPRRRADPGLIDCSSHCNTIGYIHALLPTSYPYHPRANDSHNLNTISRSEIPKLHHKAIRLRGRSVLRQENPLRNLELDDWRFSDLL